MLLFRCHCLLRAAAAAAAMLPAAAAFRADAVMLSRAAAMLPGYMLRFQRLPSAFYCHAPRHAPLPLDTHDISLPLPLHVITSHASAATAMLMPRYATCHDSRAAAAVFDFRRCHLRLIYARRRCHLRQHIR